MNVSMGDFMPLQGAIDLPDALRKSMDGFIPLAVARYGKAREELNLREILGIFLEVYLDENWEERQSSSRALSSFEVFVGLLDLSPKPPRMYFKFCMGLLHSVVSLLRSDSAREGLQTLLVGVQKLPNDDSFDLPSFGLSSLYQKHFSYVASLGWDLRGESSLHSEVFPFHKTVTKPVMSKEDLAVSGRLANFYAEKALLFILRDFPEGISEFMHCIRMARAFVCRGQGVDSADAAYIVERDFQLHLMGQFLDVRVS